MEKLVLSELWEKDFPSRKASLQRMQQHQFSYEDMKEQMRQNEEIRQNNMKLMQKQDGNKSKK